MYHTDSQLQCSNYVVDDSIVEVVDMSSEVPTPTNRSPKRKPSQTQPRVSTDVHQLSKYKPVQATETTNSPLVKKKFTVLGGSMVRDIGSIISSGLPKLNTFVYSISGLRIQEAIEQSKTVFADHCDGDIAVLQFFFFFFFFYTQTFISTNDI